MIAPLLSVENLSKNYGDFRAVKGVSFSVQPGELLALIGPNGAGKTTCFNMLMGQITPTSGRIVFAGNDITGKSPRSIWRLGVGRTFQIATVFASMTVLENVQVALLSYQRQAFQLFNWWAAASSQKAHDLLEMVGLRAQHSRPCSALAYGDIKRLELAMALANAPQLLLMDEPTAGMAAGERESLMQCVHAIVTQKKMAVLFTEHDMDAVFAHADRILVLDRGKLIAEGAPDAVRANPQVQSVYLGAGATFQ